jgi:hypothetical protein
MAAIDLMRGHATPADLRELKAKGWTIAQIAKYFRISEGTARRAMKHENGIVNVRPSGVGLKQFADDDGHFVPSSEVLSSLGRTSPDFIAEKLTRNPSEDLPSYSLMASDPAPASVFRKAASCINDLPGLGDSSMAEYTARIVRRELKRGTSHRDIRLKLKSQKILSSIKIVFN